MHKESEIIVAVLQTLKSRGIVGLGLHDGLLVAASKADDAQAVMEDVAEAATWYRLPVTGKTLHIEVSA